MSIQRDPYNWSGKLYEKYCLEMGNYTRENVVRALSAARQRNEIAFLREWPTRFENHRLVEKGMADMFIYLVRARGDSIRRMTLYMCLMVSCECNS
jgi:hypothetical protein